MAIKILLVEDNETQLKFLEEGLVQCGFEVETAQNGSEAYRKLYSTAPDIVVSDIVMPAIDGYQLCRIIKNVDETKKIPVILLTILDNKIDSFWGKKAGAQLFLSKLIDINELATNINATVRRYPITDEYKNALIQKDGADNSAQFRLNFILNDLLMKSTFSNEFRNLSDFLNYERILVEKMFSLLSSFVEYHVAGIYFASPDDFAENILYIDTLGRNLPKSLLSDVNYDFFRKMEEHKTMKTSKFEVVRMLLGKELECEFGDLTSKIIIPLIFDKKLIGGICFYTRQEIDYSSFRYFDIMISELLAIFKMKYQYTEKEFMSVLDGLTGLYNRRQLEISLEQEFNRTKRHPSDFSLAILDIDFFKKVNDNYGHQYGDYVLKTVADLMKQAFRKTDLLYRYGGEELVMIMPETNIEGATIPVQRLRRMVEEYNFDYNGVKAKVTVSIGLTMNYPIFNSSADLLKSADEALYKAKESGRNRVILHE
ncbi:MAG: diguanylate cyclase [Cyanobacteria bacterium SIG28]|nr:diguanylate cyclase [Cyanobacteria bacterium SIG28]